MKKLLKFGIVSLSVATLSGFLPGQLNQGLTEQLTVYAEDGQADLTSTETEGSVTETKEESVTDSVSPEDKVVEEVEAEGAAEETVADESEKMAEESPVRPSSDIPSVGTSTRSTPADEVVEIVNRPLKRAILEHLGHTGQIDEETAKRVTEEYLYKTIEEGTIEEGLIRREEVYALNPNYLKYDISKEELDSIKELKVYASDGKVFIDYDFSMPLHKLEFSELNKLTNLKGLIVNDSGPSYSQKYYEINDLDFSTLPPVTHLSVGYFNSYSLDAAKLSQAKQLEFLSGAVTNLSVVNKLPNLKHLLVEESYQENEGYRGSKVLVKTDELQSIIDHGQLETLAFVTDSLDNLPNFSNLKNLKRLLIAVEPKVGVPQTFDLDKIKNNKQLEILAIEPSLGTSKYDSEVQLHLANTQVLPSLENLKHLSLRRFENIQDHLPAIGQLSQLISLELSSGNLTEVSALSNLSNLEELTLTFNELTDISDLANLSKLSRLFVGYNKISNIDDYWKKEKFSIHLGANPIVTEEFRKFVEVHHNEDASFRVSVVAGGKGGAGQGFNFSPQYMYSSSYSGYDRLYRQSLAGELDKPLSSSSDTSQPTEKVLDSSQVPLTVTVSAADSSDIVAIEASRVTDQSVLSKLPTNLPQADVELYDIKTVDDKGGFVQITNPAKVTLAVDSSRKVTKVIYFLPETGAVEELPFILSEDGTQVSFDVTHFSQYGVVYESKTSSSEQTPLPAPRDEVKTKTITIVEERQDVDGKVVFTKTHTFVLKPDQVETLPLDQTVDQLIRGSNIAAYNAYEDGAVIHFTTRKRPITQDQTPKVLTDQDLATFAEIARLYDEVIALGGKPWDQLHGIAEIAKSGDKERMTNVLYNYENIRGFVTRLENQLAELKKVQETPKPELKNLSSARTKLLLEIDKSSLTDQQKGQLAEKTAFAETEKDLADLKAELVKLVKAVEKPADKPAGKSGFTPTETAKSATSTSAKSAKAGLPATGDRGELGLLTAGLTLLLASLGLTKKRRN